MIKLKHYSNSRKVNKILWLIGILSITTYLLSAQVAYDYLDINNVKALISADGLLFTDFSNDTVASYEIPKGGNKHTILGSSLWIAGFDTANNLHAAANTYKTSSKTDYWQGPLDTINGTASNPANWNEVWKVNKATIIDHINNYSN